MISRRSSRGKIHSTRWSCPISVKIHARRRKGETTGNTNVDLQRCNRRGHASDPGSATLTPGTLWLVLLILLGFFTISRPGCGDPPWLTGSFPLRSQSYCSTSRTAPAPIKCLRLSRRLGMVALGGARGVPAANAKKL